jgi:hypothetical protein
MSSNELRRQSKLVKTLCAVCQQRKARFRYRGEVRADRDHTLCFKCYRGEVNRARARRLIADDDLADDRISSRSRRDSSGTSAEASTIWLSTGTSIEDKRKDDPSQRYVVPPSLMRLRPCANTCACGVLSCE